MSQSSRNAAWSRDSSTHISICIRRRMANAARCTSVRGGSGRSAAYSSSSAARSRSYARPVLELEQRDREVVEEEAPAAVVEVDHARRGAREQVVLLVQVAVDEARRARLRGQLACARLDEGERRGERGGIRVGDRAGDQLEAAIGVLPPPRTGGRRTADAGRPGERRERIDPRPREPGGRRPALRMVVQRRCQPRDPAQVRGREPRVDEPAVQPAEQRADPRLRHQRIGHADRERAVPPGHGLGHREPGVAPQRVQPRQLRGDRLRRVDAGPPDPQHVAPADAERRVVLVPQRDQTGVLQAVARKRRAGEAPQSARAAHDAPDPPRSSEAPAAVDGRERGTRRKLPSDPRAGAGIALRLAGRS